MDGLTGFFGQLAGVMGQLSGSMLKTLEIFVLTLVLSLPLGLVVAFGRMAKRPIIRWVARAYISVMRGTPLMLQLLVVYFGPYYAFGIRISPSYRDVAVIIGFVLNYAAYFAEIYRAGIEAIPVGQYEAASVLGYNRAQTFIKIVMPQVVKRILPPVTNEVITLVKDTSLAYSIAVIEMFTMAKQLAAAQRSMMPFLAAGIFYYVFNAIVAAVMERFERKLSYYR